MICVDVRLVPESLYLTGRAGPECMAQELLCCSRNCQPGWDYTAPEETKGATGTLPQVALLVPGVSTPLNGVLELAMLNVSFINSCYGNWQIFINHLKRSPCHWGLLMLHWNMEWFC